MDEIREEITRVARDLFYQSGCKEGNDLTNWLAAEKLVMSWHESFEEREKHIGASLESQPMPAPGPDEVVH